MKITRIVATNNQRLLARKAADNSGSSSALADSVKMPRPSNARGAHASQMTARLELNPLMLFSSIMGPFIRLAS